MLKALKNLLGLNKVVSSFPPSRIMANQLLTQRIGTNWFGDEGDLAITVTDRDLSEYLTEIRLQSRKWVMNSTNTDLSRNSMLWNTKSKQLGVYTGRVKRILHEQSKLLTASVLSARWKNESRLDAVLLYMRLVEYDLNRSINNLESQSISVNLYSK